MAGPVSQPTGLATMWVATESGTALREGGTLGMGLVLGDILVKEATQEGIPGKGLTQEELPGKEGGS